MFMIYTFVLSSCLLLSGYSIIIISIVSQIYHPTIIIDILYEVKYYYSLTHKSKVLLCTVVYINWPSRYAAE